jgi:hypothetical protein
MSLRVLPVKDAAISITEFRDCFVAKLLAMTTKLQGAAPLLSSPLFSKSFSNFLEIGLHYRRHLEVFAQLIAGIIVAVSAVDNAFFLSAFSYFTNKALTDVLSGGWDAANTVNILRLEWMVISLCPIFGNFLPFFIVVVLRGDIGFAIGANKAAVGDLLFHSYSPPPLSPSLEKAGGSLYSLFK